MPIGGRRHESRPCHGQERRRRSGPIRVGDASVSGWEGVMQTILAGGMVRDEVGPCVPW